MKKHFTLAYFSGTGCTKAVCDCFERQLVDLGIDCNKIYIADCDPREVKAADFLVIFSPVYAFRLASIVEEWIEKLPQVKNIPAAIISVSGGGEVGINSACRVTGKGILTEKGYEIVYEQMIVMPCNFMVQAERLNSALIAVLPDKVGTIIHDILSGRKRLVKPKLSGSVFSAIGKAEHFGAKSFGASIKASAMCSGCEICAVNCPQGNIIMKCSRPQFGRNCIMCLKCIYSCPNRALLPGKGKAVILKDGFDLEKMSGADIKEPDEEDYRRYRGLAWKGVVEYLKGMQ